MTPALTNKNPIPMGKWQRVRSWSIRIVLVVAVTAGMLTGLLWWQDRPLRQAEAALATNDLRYADYLLSTFISKHPSDARALALQARTLVQLGRPHEAIQIFGNIGTATDEDVHALAQAYLLEQKWSMAIPLLDQVLRLDPRNADALHELTVANMRVSRLAEALKSGERMARLPGSEARGYLLVGTIHSDMRNYVNASEAYEMVLKYEPEAKNLQIPPAEFYLNYAKMLMQLGKADTAIELLKLSVATHETGEAFVLLGNAASQLGEAEKARNAWLKAVQIEPFNFEARENLANHDLQNGDGKSALGWLKAIESNPEMTSATAYLFQRAYFALGDKTNAESWKKRAETIREKEKRRMAIETSLVETPDSFWSRVIRAHRFAANGNWGEAEFMIKGLIKAAPNEPFVIDLDDAIHRKMPPPSIDRIPLEHF